MIISRAAQQQGHSRDGLTIEPNGLGERLMYSRPLSGGSAPFFQFPSNTDLSDGGSQG